MKVESDTRYSVRDVFETFPWPQSPSVRQVKEVATAARTIRDVRDKAIATTGGGLRDLYRTLELPGKHPLRTAHEELDDAVRQAYGIANREQELTFLIALNQSVNETTKGGGRVQSPGLPTCVSERSPFVSTDAYKA